MDLFVRLHLGELAGQHLLSGRLGHHRALAAIDGDGGQLAGVIDAQDLGQPLADVVREALRAQAAASPFLSALRLAERVIVVPDHVPVAAVGAALLGRPA